MRQLSLFRSLLFLLPVSLLAPPQAQSQEKPLTLEDYGQWENLGSFATLSDNGEWVAYGLTRNNEENELRIVSSDGGDERIVAFGAGPVFSEDRRWVAYRIQPSPQESAELREKKEAVHNALGIMEIGASPGASGDADPMRIENVQRFAFSGDGSYLAYLKYAPKDAEGDVGQVLLMRELATGTEVHFGNVGDFAWAHEGHLLALIISASGMEGNGVHLFDPASGQLKVLDSENTSYEGLTWREDGADLALFKATPDSLFADTAFSALAWSRLGSGTPMAYTLTSEAVGAGNDGMGVVTFRDPQWAEDGTTLFFGIKERTAKSEELEFTVRDSSTVEVWHAKDVDVMPFQQLRDRDLRQENYLAAWELGENGATRLETELTESVRLLDGGRLALGMDNTPWELDGRFFPARNDLYRLDVRSGETHAITEGARYSYPGTSGKKLLYTEDETFWIYDMVSDSRVRIDELIPTSLVNTVDDHPMPERRPWGVGGWTEDDGSVLIYDRYDVWEVRADGSGATRLTLGAEGDVQHRYLRVDPEQDFVDMTGPVYFSLFGEWTKKSGMARLNGRGGDLERMIWEDKSVGRLQKAADADRFVYRAEAFDDSPDLFASGADLSRARQITQTNSFQSEYQWGWTELVEYDNPVSDARLQGILHYPAGYEEGKEYPMIVYYYERVSNGIHRYRTPSERSAYNPTVFTSQGYFVLQPDLTYEVGNPGHSALACVESAVTTVLDMGMIDPDAIGITGHSWGGYETVFFSTHSDLFAAGIAGSPLTNLVSMYGMMFWNIGLPETSHYQWSQERMGQTLWENRAGYVDNSPVFDFDKLETPLLMAVGSDDGNVDWHQGIEAYNFARRLDKQFVFLVYRGENHSNSEKPNQVDYHHRQLEWFGHYLKGEPAAGWITSGVSWIEQEKARAKK
jgi:dipeptidyl aminopeptidase/acylaminoacyl peptidase